MKQGPAENMTVAVLKELLKDKGIAFSSKAKKSELVDLFNTFHHTSTRPSCMKVRVPVATHFHVLQLLTMAVFQSSSSLG